MPPREPGSREAALYEQFLRPVYLVFDQLEELFVLGSAAEQQQFIQVFGDKVLPILAKS